MIIFRFEDFESHICFVSPVPSVGHVPGAHSVVSTELIHFLCNYCSEKNVAIEKKKHKKTLKKPMQPCQTKYCGMVFKTIAP